MNVFQSFISLGCNNLLSIGLGFVSWILPVIYLCTKKHREGLTCASLTCVVFSLYFQLREGMRLADLENWALIEDLVNGVAAAAAGLILVTLALNIAAWRKK